LHCAEISKFLWCYQCQGNER